MPNVQSISGAGSSAQLDRQIAHMVKALTEIRATEVPQAFATALNKAAAQAATATVRGVAGAVRVPQKLIRKRVYVRKANRNKLVSQVRSYYGGVNLIRLNPRDTGRYTKKWQGRVGRGVVARGGHRSDFGWIAKDKRGQRLVFELTGGSRKKTVISVAYIHIHEEIDKVAPEAANQIMSTKLSQLVAHELQYRIRKHQEKR